MLRIFSCGYRPRVLEVEINTNFHSNMLRAMVPNTKHVWTSGCIYGSGIAAFELAAAQYGYKLIYDEGPLDTNKKRRVPHEAVYATTDPVAMDLLGWGVVEGWRKDNGLPTLKDAGREPTYIRTAGDLGLGVYDKNRISLRLATLSMDR